MAVNLEAKSTKELETIIGNCVRLNRTSDPIYAASRGILENRRTGDFDMEKTVAAIINSGKAGRFLSYKDIADASGLNWATSRRRVGLHLDALCVFSEGNGWPLLSAIVVHKDKLDTGTMREDNRKGFLDATRASGRIIDIEEDTFIRREQIRVFEWCRTFK
jgi:5-methylcytosine-specific restriction protein B